MTTPPPQFADFIQQMIRQHELIVTGISEATVRLSGSSSRLSGQEYYLGIRNGDVTITYGGDPVEGSRACLVPGSCPSPWELLKRR